MPHLTVVVPAYNEAKRLENALCALAAYYDEQPYTYDVIVVSDGSTDATPQICQAFAIDHPQFSLIENPANRGKGHAVRTGMLKARGSYVLFCDADLATPPQETQKLIDAIRKGADVAIGSRPLKESHLVKRQPRLREAMGRAANKVIRLLGVKGIRDTQCGFKMFTDRAARDIFSRSKLNGFSFDFEVLMIAQDLKWDIVEIPVTWADQPGSSVVPRRDYPRCLRDLIKLRWMGRRKRIAFPY